MTNKSASLLGSLPRIWKRVIIVAFDIVGLCVALWASFALRYFEWSPPTTIDHLMVIATAPMVAIPIFVRLGLYRAVIRYLPERALWQILQATTLAAIGWVVLVFLSELSGRVTIPRSVPVIYWMLSFLLIGGSRFVAKRLLWAPRTQNAKDHPIAIYGAGVSGAQLIDALRRQGNQFIVAVVDEDPALHGRDLAGVRVFAPTMLESLAQQYGVKELILCEPSLSAAKRREIVTQAAPLGMKIRSVPSVTDLVDGKYTVSQLREIEIDDLLGRSSVPPDPALIREMVVGKTIMVTGAGGSIGSELCRLIVGWAPQRLVLFEANEFALYQIDRELSVIKDISVVPVLGTITDEAVVRRAIAGHGVDVLFHAAAYKHVPLVEANALEGIRNNVLGTKVITDAALELGVQSIVLISSDKAVRPTNVMGATKRWAELLFHEASVQAAKFGRGQRFSAVRFGNVLGSNGSVVPLFKEQIAAGGPVTLTDAAMTRYFMSIREAAELIVQAGALSKGGDVFLLDMGKPILIKDLAENMIRLAGFTVRDEQHPDGDIAIVAVGKRPGEKMYEELFYDDNTVSPTRHQKIMRSPRNDTSERNIVADLATLMDALAAEDESRARHILFEVIQETAPRI
jgi:FlaA1/EpsC-like NDP-sugar epimerase